MKSFIRLIFLPILIGSLLSSCTKSNESLTNQSDDSKKMSGQAVLQEILAKINVEIDPNKISPYFGGKAKRHSHKNIKKLCLADEQQFEFIQKDIIYNLEAAFKNGELDKLEKSLAKDNAIFLFDKRINPIARDTKEGIEEFNWSLEKRTMPYANAKQSITKYISSFSSIVDFDLSTIKFISPVRFRNPADLSMKRAKLLSRFDLRGLGKNGERRHDRGIWSIDVELVDGSWKIREIELIKGETLVKAGRPAFKDATAEVIGGVVPTYLRTEAIRRGGYGLSISDYDGDGSHDVFIGTREEGLLLRAGVDLKFKEVNVGTQGNKLVKTAIFGDFFNSGREDLVLVRFVPDFLKTDNTHGSYSDIVFYENIGKGKFKKIDKLIKNRKMSGNAMPAAIADFNGDNKLDLYVGFPGPLDFTFIGNSDAGTTQGAQVQGLFLNNGDSKTFTDRTDENITYSGLEYLFAHASASVDLDQDGDMDIIVLDDRGNLSPVYLNDGTGHFSESAKITGIVNSDLSMSLAQGDLDNDGKLDFAITNVNFVAAERWSQSCGTNWRGVEFIDYGRNGLRIFGGQGKGKFRDVTDMSGLEWAGEGMAGVEFVDYNNDGLLDIYVVNGLWSGNTRKQDLSSTFIRALQSDYSQLSYEMTSDYTASNFMKVLTSFKGNLLDANAKEQNSGGSHLAGFQRNRLFRNNGNGKFTEIGFLEGIDSIADGYIIASADLNKDGKMDMLIRNGDPGLRSVRFETVQAFINQTDTKSKSLVLKLKGSQSNSNAIGAFVTADIGGKSYLRHLIGNSGTAQSEKILHFGLKDRNKVDKLVIKWPSGAVQTLKNVAAGRLTITEPYSKELKISKK